MERPGTISGLESGPARGAYRALIAGFFGITFSIALGEPLVAVSLLLLIVAAVRKRRFEPWPAIVWIAAAFVAIAVFTAVLGVNPERAVRKMDRLFWFVTFPLAASLIRGTTRVRHALVACVAGTAVLALDIIILRSMTACRLVREAAVQTPDYISAMVHLGSMTDGQMLMLGVLASIGLIACKACAGRQRAVLMLLLLLQIAALVLNFKRGSWACALVIAAALILWRANWKALVALILVVAATICLPSVQKRILDLKNEFDPRGGGRATMWVTIAPAMIKDHPWGIGYAAMTEDLLKEYSPDVEPYRNHLHSNIAQILVETGWAGLAVYVIWMLAAIRDRVVRIRRSDDLDERTLATTVLAMLLALMANGLIEYNFGDTELMIAYGFLMGMGLRGNSE